jgi:hypothetical protein
MENLQQSPNWFECVYCDYKCYKKSEWTKHSLTTKHKNRTLSNNLEQKISVVKHLSCKYCNKQYNARNSLWYHENKCCKDITLTNNNDSNLVNQLLKQNDDFKQLILEQNKLFIGQNQDIQKQNQELQQQILDVCKNGIIQNNTINQVNTNSNNKTFNLQVFLNEDCKDAMNISDFMSSIQLQLEELVSVGKLGFVEGISNIIIKNLKALDIHKRPLHCTDLKRETVYIKENGVWIKDDEDNTKLRKVIKNVAFRNSKNTRLFKDKYPDCVRSESRLSDTYSIIIIEAMGGGSKTDPKESEDKILRRILKELTIDKSRYLS